MIQPVYVTFEQAKWLKEKGFDEHCYRTYNHQQELSPFPITENMGGEKVDPLSYKWNNSAIHSSNTTAPEQWQVVEWLRVNHGIWVSVHLELCRGYEGYDFNFEYLNDKEKTIKEQEKQYKELGETVFNSPQEAYSAAFDYIRLNNLI
jgi:hypothetical protein